MLAAMRSEDNRAEVDMPADNVAGRPWARAAGIIRSAILSGQDSRSPVAPDGTSRPGETKDLTNEPQHAARIRTKFADFIRMCAELKAKGTY